MKTQQKDLHPVRIAPTNVQLSQDKSGKDYWLKYAKKKNEGGYHRTLNKGKKRKTTEMIGLKAGS